MAYMAGYSGPGGHSSLSDTVAAPVLSAARLGAALGDYGKANLEAGTGSYRGLCVNVGMIDSDLSSMAVQPPLQARDLAGFAPYFDGQELRAIDLPYWTEAAMLSAAGIDCVVYGPGDVEQAHRPNEFVSKSQLEMASKVYAKALFNNS